MKKIFTIVSIFILSLLFNTASFAQFDTTGGRYYNLIFSNVTKHTNVVYGASVQSGSINNLLMDVYEPAGDATIIRPLIIMAHGGSFQAGDKGNSDMVDICTRFAKMGYVTASINYRVGFFPIDSLNATKAVLKAVQDMKAAIRYFRKDAATTNTYKIHSDYIFIGGSSAGAILSLHLAYMDKNSEVPLDSAKLAALGGLEGASGNPGYASNAAAVINLCGAMGKASWIEPGNISFVSMHGNADGTVPYGHALLSSFGFAVLYVDGSAALHPYAASIGVNNPFYTFQGADHVPYLTNLAYMDTTINFIRDFLRPLLPVTISAVNENTSLASIHLYPNPAMDNVSVYFDKTNNLQYQLADVSGRIIRTANLTQSNNTIERGNLAAGVYLLNLSNEKQHHTIMKIVFY